MEVARKMFELLDGMVEETGGENVVQVVVDGTSIHGSQLHVGREKDKLFWSSCVVHCLDLIGELPVFHDTIMKAKSQLSSIGALGCLICIEGTRKARSWLDWLSLYLLLISL